MTSSIVCDHCGKPVDKDRVIVRVDKSPSKGTLFDPEVPVHQLFGFALDLHLTCYNEHYKPHLEVVDGFR